MPLRDEDPARVRAELRPRLVNAYGRWERSEGTAHTPETWFEVLASALQQEANTLEQMVVLSEFAFVECVSHFTPEAREALKGEWPLAILRRCREALTEEALTTPASAQNFFRDLRHEFRDRAGLRGRQVMFPLRAALTGTMVGPCLGVVASLLGLARCVQRLEDALKWIPSNLSCGNASVSRGVAIESRPRP